MNDSKVKSYATWARRELIAEVMRRCALFDVSESPASPAGADSVGGRVLTSDEKAQRRELLAQARKDMEGLVERAAYTWFNRIMSIRFMEANDRLPSHTRMFSAADGSFSPQVLKEAMTVDIEGVDRAEVARLVQAGDDEATFRYLFLAQCAELADCMPDVFEPVGSAMEMLLPDGLLRNGGIVERLVREIDEDDWRDGVEIVGWMYQYYISERKEEFFASKRKATAANLPAATQLFTPAWIVRYLVQNSLGRLWMLNNPNSRLADGMEYYIAPDPDSQEEFRRVEGPADISLIDPACGSGHILVYAFDLLAAIYEERGYARRDIPALILQENLTGVEIDPRAASMASFALTMKACEYDSRFLRRGVHPRVVVLKPVEFDDAQIEAISSTRKSQLQIGEPFILDRPELLDTLAHLDEVGSLYTPEADDIAALRNAVAALRERGDLFVMGADDRVLLALEMSEPLFAKYDVAVANPPYMGGKMSPVLSAWVKKNYPDEKGDLCTCFVARGLALVENCGMVAMITASSWMFISSFERMRKKLIDTTTVSSMIQQSTHGYPNVTVPTCMFVLDNCRYEGKGSYVRLEDFDRPQWQQPRAREAIHNPDCGWFYRANQEDFKKIPGSPIAYWASAGLLEAFQQANQVADYCTPRQGLRSGDNNRFHRVWQEVSYSKIAFSCKDGEEAFATKMKWFPHVKGGEFRRWYGNNALVINWENNGYEIKNNKDENGKQLSRPQSVSYYFKENITWSVISSGVPAFRYTPPGSIFDGNGSCLFGESRTLSYVQGFLNSSVAQEIAKIISPTLTFEVGQIGRYPIIESPDAFESVQSLVLSCRCITKNDWDSFEASWDFARHPMLPKFDLGDALVKDAFSIWDGECKERFDALKANEEELNRIFSKIYRMEGEVPIEVPDDKVSVRLADLQRDVKSLISYAVGCMFGRYSLDCDGLVLADQGDGIEQYLEKVPNPTYMPDEDGILPITDTEYFHDDITGMFVDWVRTVYGEETLEENLKFVADALGGSGNARQVIREYFCDQFFADHCATYYVVNAGKRPIYWLFDSGKKGGFRALFYMHRYTPDLLARLRTDYVHEQQERYRTQIDHIDDALTSADRREQAELKRQRKKLAEQLAETNAFEEKVHHLADQMIEIDLDDGVKDNYAKFQDVLAKIK